MRSLASAMAGPAGPSIARLNAAAEMPARRTTTGQAGLATSDIEAARRNLAAAMLASFIALLIGGAASFSAAGLAKSVFEEKK